MQNQKLFSLIVASALVAGCATKTVSISHSGYQDPHSSRGYYPTANGSDPAFDYLGELSEFDVLGITRNQVTSEDEIRRALDDSKRLKLRSGSSLLLIQSGARFPDGPMTTELGKHFTVVPFSGVPPYRRTIRGVQTESFDPESYSKSLRLAAARGGNDTIVCYWGILESATEKLATRAVSWVPGFNWMLPDEKQHMRIRLKVALVDVRTGDWAIFSPKPFEDDRLSISPRRAVADQKLVENLKQKAYKSAAKDLLDRYSEVALLK
jgi:hypothetical protein